MNGEIYISNLSDQISDNDLEKLFSKFGKIVTATVIVNKQTGKSKNFGFIKMYNKKESLNAIKALNNTNLDGKIVSVQESNTMPFRESNARFWH